MESLNAVRFAANVIIGGNHFTGQVMLYDHGLRRAGLRRIRLPGSSCRAAHAVWLTSQACLWHNGGILSCPGDDQASRECPGSRLDAAIGGSGGPEASGMTDSVLRLGTIRASGRKTLSSASSWRYTARTAQPGRVSNTWTASACQPGCLGARSAAFVCRRGGDSPSEAAEVQPGEAIGAERRCFQAARASRKGPTCARSSTAPWSVS